MKFLLKLFFAITLVVIGVIQTSGEKSSGQLKNDWDNLQRNANGYASEKTIDFCKAHADRCLAAGAALNQLIVGK